MKYSLALDARSPAHDDSCQRVWCIAEYVEREIRFHFRIGAVAHLLCGCRDRKQSLPDYFAVFHLVPITAFGKVQYQVPK